MRLVATTCVELAANIDAERSPDEKLLADQIQESTVDTLPRGDLSALPIDREVNPVEILFLGADGRRLETHPLTDAQVVSNSRLVRQLARCFPIEVLVGHSEYRSLEGSPWFREADPDYRTTKPDPGEEFVRRVRLSLNDLSLATANTWRIRRESPPEHMPRPRR